MSEDQIESSDPLAHYSTEDLLASLGQSTHSLADMSGSEWKRGYDHANEPLSRYLIARLLLRISDTLDRFEKRTSLK